MRLEVKPLHQTSGEDMKHGADRYAVLRRIVADDAEIKRADGGRSDRLRFARILAPTLRASAAAYLA